MRAHEHQNLLRHSRSAACRLWRRIGRYAGRRRWSQSAAPCRHRHLAAVHGQQPYGRQQPHEHGIYDLHVSIAQAESACVAPIGQAWDLALARDPTLTLHATDGNHSVPAGAFLTALVLYATITGQSPSDLPPMPQYPVELSLQETLRGIATETVQTIPPRMWCPGDAI
jgi:hypothetical protein